jgi:hypothetical protein
MNPEIEILMKRAVERILLKNSSEQKIKAIEKKHRNKVHFIPFQYRIMGGLLQSMNIQFGNFLEEMMHLIIEHEENLDIISNISGKKNYPMKISRKSDAKIDEYISDCQNKSQTSLKDEFHALRFEIFQSEKMDTNKFIAKHDIDVLFRDKRDGRAYYIEIKYNDDHDAEKFVDINRKFIKSYAALTNEFENFDDVTPILYFFNSKRMKGNIYIDEETSIMRGVSLFERFFETKYKDVDDYLLNISNNHEIIKIFDELYQKIRNKIY